MKARLARDLESRPDLIVIDRRGGTDARIESLLPKAYLSSYRLKLRTRDMESYVRAAR